MRREITGSILVVAAIVLLAGFGPALVRELRTLKPSTLAARADQRIVTLEVAGMTCAGCSAKVQGELTELPGVTAAEVRYEQQRAYVVCDPSVPDSALTGAVKRAGPGFIAAIATR